MNGTLQTMQAEKAIATTTTMMTKLTKNEQTNSEVENSLQHLNAHTNENEIK